MSNFLSSVVNLGKAAYERYKAPRDVNAVVVVSANAFTTAPVVDRDGGLILYGPTDRPTPHGGDSTQGGVYQIVMNSEKLRDRSFSLFLTGDVNEAEARFALYRGCIPSVLAVDESHCSQFCLQQMCDALRQHEQDGNYTVTHLVAELDIRSVVIQPEILAMLNVATNLGVTPLMCAILKQNLWMVRYLLSKGATVQNHDLEGNSAYHYAAVTCKEIMEALCERFEHFSDSSVADNLSSSSKAETKEEPKSSDLAILNHKNLAGDTPLHLACSRDKPECVYVLLCAGADANVVGVVDEEDCQNEFKSSNTKCFREILRRYPKQLQLQDVKHGGTPLHWAKSREIIEALVQDFGCKVDAKNFDGDAALHVMVKRERLECVLALIVHGANVNSRDVRGSTPLHLAVENGYVSIVRALLVFEADVGLVNESGQTPWVVSLKAMQESGLIDSISLGGNSLRDNRRLVVYSLFSVGASGNSHEVPKDLKGNRLDFAGLDKPAEMKRVRSLFDDLLANSTKRAKTESRRIGVRSRLLCLDGGGIRGLVLTRLLRSMELIIDAPIVHCFDWIAGTSTGGLLALALASGKTVLECQVIYFKMKNKVFVDSKPYDSKRFDDLLREEFGTGLKMSDVKHPKVFVTATLGDRSPPDLHLFRTYQSPQSMLGIGDFPHPELNASRCRAESSPTTTDCTLVWQAARASAAAPAYFRPDGRYIDGGILANNPSLDLLTEISEYNLALKFTGQDDDVVQPEILVSLGTGISPVRKMTVVDIFRPDSAHDTFKLMMNWDGMGKLLLESVVDSDNRVVDRCRAWCSSVGIPFHRLSPHLISAIELDETDDKILVDLMWSTMAYVQQQREDVLLIKKKLLK